MDRVRSSFWAPRPPDRKGPVVNKDLEARIRKAEAILEIGARRFLESKGALVPPLEASRKPGKARW